MNNAIFLQRAAYTLAPGMVDYAEDTYESIRWRIDNPPSKQEVEDMIPVVRKEWFMEELRAARNGLLNDSDWTQMPDAAVDQVAWAEYRQALRDLPENTIDPENPIWPTRPDEGGE